MDQIHDIIQDVEDLKYNDDQYQMNNELQNRDAQTKKGIYSDDFSNSARAVSISAAVSTRTISRRASSTPTHS